MKKLLSCLLTLGLLAGALAGCGGGTSSTADEAPASTADAAETGSEADEAPEEGGSEITDEEITLRYMWWGGDERNEATMQVIEQFEALYPNVTIEAEYGGDDGYKDKLVNQLYSGNAADIIQVGTGWMSEINANGEYFVNLNDYADIFDTSEFDDAMLDADFCTYNGKLLSVPTGGAGVAVVYSDALVEEVGLDLSIAEEDWAGLIELGKQVQAYDSSMYLLNADTIIVFQRFVRHSITQMTGEPMVVDAENRMSFTREQLLDVMQMVQDMYENGVFQPASESAPYFKAQSTNPAWIEGRLVGTLTNGSNVLAELENVDFETGWIVSDIPMPADRVNDGSWSSPSQVMVISSTCEYPEVAAAFLDYFYNNDEAIMTLGTVRGVPSHARARTMLTDAGLVDPVVGAAATLAASHNGVNEMGLTSGSELESIMVDAVERVAYGESVETVVDDVIQQIQYVLDEQE